MISRFLEGALNPDQVETLEVHCLHCRSCHRELVSEAKIVAYLREGHLHEQLRTIPRPVRAGWGIGRLAWGMAALSVVMAALFLGLLLPHWRELARTREQVRCLPPAYQSASFRGPAGPFQAGMIRYQKGEYRAAAGQLQLAANVQPGNPQVLFFLGASQLFAGLPEAAVVSFSRVIELPANVYQEESRWYLGHAYLRAGKTAAARKQFSLLAESGGNHAEVSRAILKALR